MGGGRLSEKDMRQQTNPNLCHAADPPPGFERQPQTAIQPETIDRRGRMNRPDAGELHAGPLECAFLQHAARRRIAHAGARLQRLMPQVAEGVIDDRASGLGHETVAPIAGAKPIAELCAFVARIDPASADQGAVQHQDETGFAVALVHVGDELFGIREPVGMRNARCIFGDAAVVREHRNRLYVLVTRRAKRQPFGLEDGNTAFALCRRVDVFRECHFRAPANKAKGRAGIPSPPFRSPMGSAGSTGYRQTSYDPPYYWAAASVGSTETNVRPLAFD